MPGVSTSPITAATGLTSSFKSLFRNPKATLPLLGFMSLIAGMFLIVPILGAIVALTVMGIFLPSYSAVVRARRDGVNISFAEAWASGRGLRLRTAGYTVAASLVVFAVIAVVAGGFLFAMKDFASPSSSPMVVVFFLIFVVVLTPISMAAAWWMLLTISGAAAGVLRPFSAYRLIPFGRSFGGVILGSLVASGISTGLYSLIIYPVMAFSMFPLIQDAETKVLAPDDFTVPFIIMAAGFILYAICSMFLQFMFIGGLTALFEPEDTADYYSSNRFTRAPDVNPMPIVLWTTVVSVISVVLVAVVLVVVAGIVSPMMSELSVKANEAAKEAKVRAGSSSTAGSPSTADSRFYSRALTDMGALVQGTASENAITSMPGYAAGRETASPHDYILRGDVTRADAEAVFGNIAADKEWVFRTADFFPEGKPATFTSLQGCKDAIISGSVPDPVQCIWDDADGNELVVTDIHTQMFPDTPVVIYLKLK